MGVGFLSALEREFCHKIHNRTLHLPVKKDKAKTTCNLK